MRILWTAVLVCLVMAEPGAAQIYISCDVSGHLVLSNKTQAADPTVRHQNPYEDLIEFHARRHGLAPALIRAVIRIESRFIPRAVSPRGAMGLMQLMPDTARDLGVRDPFQPAANISGGVSYLARLMGRYGQNLELALAAYNAGTNTVDRYGAIPPYRETQDYVREVTAAVKTASAPAPQQIYKWVELIDGGPIPHYSNIRRTANGRRSGVNSARHPGPITEDTPPANPHSAPRPSLSEYAMIECSRPSR